MKKYLSLILALGICMSMCVFPAAAISANEAENEVLTEDEFTELLTAEMSSNEFGGLYYEGDICQVRQRHQSQHHALVAAHEVVHEFLRFAPHLLQVIGNIGGKIVALILPLLPAGNIRFHGHNALANIAHGFVHRHRDNVDGEHHVPGIVHQLRNHLVGNKAGIFPQEQGTAHMIAQLIVIFLKGNTVRGDAVPEVMPFAYGVLQIEPE